VSPFWLRRFGFVGVLTTALLGTVHDQAPGQDSLLTVPAVIDILSTVRSSGTWDWHGVAQFVAAHYGERAGPALGAILSSPSNDANARLQIRALAAASFPRTRVPQGVLMRFAEGVGLENVHPARRGTLRQYGLMALAARPDPGLAVFWRHIAGDPEASYRQFAISGLACSLGLAAEEDIASMRGDRSSMVVDVATRVLEILQSSRGSPRTCVGGLATRDSAYIVPDSLSRELVAAADTYLPRLLRQR
jgi:hypothetical protein